MEGGNVKSFLKNYRHNLFENKPITFKKIHM